MAFTTEIEGPNERTTTAEEAFTTKARALVTIEVKDIVFLKTGSNTRNNFKRG